MRSSIDRLRIRIGVGYGDDRATLCARGRPERLLPVPVGVLLWMPVATQNHQPPLSPGLLAATVLFTMLVPFRMDYRPRRPICSKCHAENTAITKAGEPGVFHRDQQCHSCRGRVPRLSKDRHKLPVIRQQCRLRIACSSS